MTVANDMEQKLAEKPVGSLLLELSLPAIAAQIITLIYNIVDRIYIGHLADGALAMAGVGLCLPVVTIVTAFTGLFGRGGGPLTSIELGRGDRKKAEQILGNCFFCLAAVSILMTVVVLIWQRPLLILFGGSEQTVPYGLDYLSVYALGTVFVQLSVGLNYFINAQGFSRFGMMTLLIGGVLNILLDPLLIFTMGMGVRGAALATVISQGVSCIWVVAFLLSKKTMLHLRPENLRLRPAILKEVVGLGFSPFFMRCSEGALQACFNAQLAAYGGDLAVSSMSIMISMFDFLLLPGEGIAQGSQPIIGFNYGAKNFDRVRQTFRKTLRASLLYTSAGCMLMELFPRLFVRWFTADVQLIGVATEMLRIYIAGCLIVGANSTIQETYLALGDGGRSFFFAFFRKIVLLIPLLYIFPAVLPWGWRAVVLAEPVSDMLTTVTNSLYFRGYIQKKLQ